MKALVTGASSGMGKDMAIYLSQKGYDIIAVARNKDELEKLKPNIKTDLKIESVDLSIKENVIDLTKKYLDVDVLINDAGFGKFGDFKDVSQDEELSMINTNVVACHILTKYFLAIMEEKNSGYILNVASIAGLLPGGPLMATYYATKSYVVSLTRGIQEELRVKHSNVKVSLLCPGPVDTNFNNVAGVKFSLGSLKSKDVAKYAIDNMFKGKDLILPGKSIKALNIASKLVPAKPVLHMTYKRQKSKDKS